MFPTMGSARPARRRTCDPIPHNLLQVRFRHVIESSEKGFALCLATWVPDCLMAHHFSLRGPYYGI